MSRFSTGEYAHRVLEVVAERREKEDEALPVGEALEEAAELGQVEHRLPTRYALSEF